MRRWTHPLFAALGWALAASLLCAAAGVAQEVGAGAPADVSGEVKAPAAMTPAGVPGIPAPKSAVKEGQKPAGWLGCTRACPICLRSCELNPGHYGNHMCSEGHTF